MKRLLLFGVFLFVIAYAGAWIVELPAKPKCTGGASSTAILANGQVVGPNVSGCVPR